MTIILILLVLILGAGVWYAHKKHMDALTLIRTDIADLTTKVKAKL